AAAVRRLRDGVCPHADPQLRRPGPLRSQQRPPVCVFSFERAFTRMLLRLQPRCQDLLMNQHPRWCSPRRLFRFKTSTAMPAAVFTAVLALLLPFAASAQQQGLELDIVGGNAAALPIAVVPMPYQGGAV